MYDENIKSHLPCFFRESTVKNQNKTKKTQQISHSIKKKHAQKQLRFWKKNNEQFV